MGLLSRLFGGQRRNTGNYRPSYRPSGFSPMAVGTGVAMMGAPMYYGQQQARPTQYRPSAYHQQVAGRSGLAPQPFFGTARAMGNLPNFDKDPNGYLQTLSNYGTHMPRSPIATHRAGVFGNEYAPDDYNLYTGEGENNPRYTGLIRTPTWNMWNQAGNDLYGTGFTMARWGQGADRKKDRPLEALYSGYTRVLRDAEGNVINDDDGNPMRSRPVDLFQRGDGTWVMGYPKVDANGQIIRGQYDRVERGGKDDKWIPNLMVGDQSWADYMAARQAAAEQAAQQGTNPVAGAGTQTDGGAAGQDVFATQPGASADPVALSNQAIDQEAEYARSSYDAYRQQIEANSYNGFGNYEAGSVFGIGMGLDDQWSRNREIWRNQGLIGEIPAEGDLTPYIEAARNHQNGAMTGTSPFIYGDQIYEVGDLQQAIQSREAALQQQMEQHRQASLNALQQQNSFGDVLDASSGRVPMDAPALDVVRQQHSQWGQTYQENFDARYGSNGLNGQLEQVQGWGGELNGYMNPPAETVPTGGQAPMGGEVMPTGK